MTNVTWDMNTDGVRSWVSMSCELTQEEWDRVDGPIEQHLQVSEEGTLWMLNVPINLLSGPQ